ncbi:DUF1501 domain-containing protein [Undibacterium macrobrachii]|jgi:uncharacterized protein (DUF1501 family)|uniref:DUF1501 domain-containing protein n=1 Tax=Undibacterium macrobrachii TaxID=1119058 RepID=A0ABQ2XBT4_9BURK|nr:DUF1501 domain-containing protein [Undibacterium macrobrachii]GGX08850.1 hypothetical protein GCM10011282_13800 [Undibacterium macrobrachii]
MNRRDLLKSFAVAATSLSATGFSTQLLAAPTVQQRCLVVFLRGAYDASNLLVPISSSFYYESRPNIAIAKPSADPLSALALNADWGLHPALRDSIYPMFQAGEAAFIPFAGTHDLSRSHFETQDSIEMGQELGGSRNFQSGFMNRLAAQLNGTSAMSFTEQLPIIMRGETKVANVALQKASKNSLDDRQSKIIAQMYGKTALEKQVEDGFAVRGEVVQNMKAEEVTLNNDGNRDAISTKGFALEAKRIGKMMRDKYALGFIDVGGWDTHVNQGGANGVLANKLEELGRGLLAYKAEMGSVWKNTTVVVISEFGRTFRENGKRGTDHGHGSVYWVLGGGVKGGRIVGEQIALTANSLFQNRDYPVLNEYRAVLGGVFARSYGLSASQMQQVFAGVTPLDLGLV